MERPNEKIWCSLETMKLLNELNLTESDTARALKYLFPDVYDTEEKAMKQAENIKTKPLLSKYTDEAKKHFEYYKKDMEMLRNELTQIGLCVNV